MSHTEKVKVFAWYLHSEDKADRFMGADIARCYESALLPKPSSFGPYISQLEKAKEVLRDARGLYLSGKVRNGLNQKYGQRAITVEIARMLESLPDQVPDLAEKTFLLETITCLKNGAFRASIVMAWNLAFHHLCDYIVRSPRRLADFNRQWPVVYQGHHRKGPRIISRMEDLSEELRESEIIEVANSAGIITREQWKTLSSKLGVRNSAAHPSNTKLEQLQAEEFVDSIVKNVVLKLPESS